jgi:hypothetical protein
MKTTHISVEFNKNHATVGMERNNEYEHKYFIPDDQTLTMALNCSRISWGKITGFLGRPVIMGFLLFFSYTP